MTTMMTIETELSSVTFATLFKDFVFFQNAIDFPTSCSLIALLLLLVLLSLSTTPFGEKLLLFIEEFGFLHFSVFDDPKGWKISEWPPGETVEMVWTAVVSAVSVILSEEPAVRLDRSVHLHRVRFTRNFLHSKILSQALAIIELT